MVKVRLISSFLNMHTGDLKQNSCFPYLSGCLVLTFHLIILKALDLERKLGYEFP